MHGLMELSTSLPDFGDRWTTVGVIVALFVAAWLFSRASNVLAGIIVRRYERRSLSDETAPADTGALIRLKRHETMLSLVRTSVRYVAYGIAIVLSVAQLSGWGKGTAIAGASILVVLIGFAGQRFLTDLVAGLLMVFEDWFSVGDTITIEPWSLSGVVEEVSLRSTTLRSVTGETIRIGNSQVIAARLLPRGARDVEIELFVTDGDDARRLMEDVAQIVPAGPTRFIRRPTVVEIEPLDVQLTRILVTATVAHGREWLVEAFLPELVRERAPDGLIMHGPVVMFVDESATRRFARSVTVSRSATERRSDTTRSR
jgi:moderate conductance mechanosensitive channel